MGTPIPCPDCGGEGVVPADSEGDRPMVICDMCGGAGWVILDPEPSTATIPRRNTED